MSTGDPIGRLGARRTSQASSTLVSASTAITGESMRSVEASVRVEHVNGL